MKNHGSCRARKGTSYRATTRKRGGAGQSHSGGDACQPSGQLEPALLGKPEVLVADAGYHSKENVERCVEQHRAVSRAPGTPQPAAEDPRPRVSCLRCGDGVCHRFRRAIYSKSVETVFGVIKEVLGFRRFHLRGLRGAEGHMCTAWNRSGCMPWQEDKWGQCVPVDELWRRNGRRSWRVLLATIPPEQPQSLPKALLRHPTVRYRARRPPRRPLGSLTS